MTHTMTRHSADNTVAPCRQKVVSLKVKNDNAVSESPFGFCMDLKNDFKE